MIEKKDIIEFLKLEDKDFENLLNFFKEENNFPKNIKIFSFESLKEKEINLLKKELEKVLLNLEESFSIKIVSSYTSDSLNLIEKTLLELKDKNKLYFYLISLLFEKFNFLKNLIKDNKKDFLQIYLVNDLELNLIYKILINYYKNKKYQKGLLDWISLNLELFNLEKQIFLIKNKKSYYFKKFDLILSYFIKCKKLILINNNMKVKEKVNLILDNILKQIYIY